MKQTSKGQAYGESAFDVLYLLAVIALGIWYVFMAQTKSDNTLLLYGCMALVLGFGDSFHLVPRILHYFAKQPDKYIPYLGIGKMITSITMTIFYVMLYYIWVLQYPTFPLPFAISAIVIALAGIRILLCLFPQNCWKSLEDKGYWSIYRNIPFFLLGIVIILLYAYSGYHTKDGFLLMPLAIAISFLCYAPVTIYASKYPKVGMLMIPKTLMYIWIICMGIQLL